MIYNLGRAETKPGSPHIHKASPSVRGELPWHSIGTNRSKHYPERFGS